MINCKPWGNTHVQAEALPLRDFSLRFMRLVARHKAHEPQKTFRSPKATILKNHNTRLNVTIALIQVLIRRQRQKLDKLLFGNDVVEQLSGCVELTCGVLLLSNHAFDLIQFVR